MSNNAAPEVQKTAFGEATSAEITPITQINASYGIFSDVLTVVDSSPSGTTTVVDNMYTVQTGTAPDGLASILSFRQLKFRQGQGGAARFTALFTLGVANTQQAAGFITAENVFAFGYIGTAFGIVHAFDGEAEHQELTVTVAGGAETATVTIDGVAYPVVLTVGSGTVQHTAFELASELNGTVPNYTITSNNDQVIAQALISGPQGAFTFSSTGTAAAAWSQITAGVDPTLNFIPQASWNGDTRLDGDSQDVLDPTKGNLYQIQGCMGFGSVGFFIEDSKSAELILVHRIQSANTRITPVTSNPVYRVGWLVRNLGNTSNITIQGDSASSYIQGKIERAGQPRSDSNNQLSVGVLQTNLIAFRNRASFSGRVNRIEILPNLITAANEANKSAVFELIIEPVFSGDLDWSYLDKTTSVMEVATDAVTLLGGRSIGTFVIATNSNDQARFNVTRQQITAIQNSLTFAIVGNTTSGAAGDLIAGLVWIEDH
jgi:hypothetical protein